MFASRVRKDVQIKVPQAEISEFLGTDEITVTIRKLSGATLEKARTQATIGQATQLRALGADLVRGLQTVPRESLAAAQEELARKKAEEETLVGRKSARYAAHDRETVLNAGIVGWSCQDRMPLRPDTIADLDDAAARLIHEAILDLSLPSLDPAEVAAEGKGGSVPSTST